MDLCRTISVVSAKARPSRFKAPSAILFCARPCATPCSSQPEPGSRHFDPCCPGCWRKRTVIADATSGCSSECAASRTFTIARSLNASPPNTPTFIFCPRLSRAAADWKGLRGYVQEHLAEIVGTRTDMHAYICGLDKMVKANRALLKSLGWDRSSIRYEKYD